uniref:Transketolase isoform 3 n=1 Tax=Homo sapiens TaxID=9606 RepID=A0A0S2Z4T2_HUMAN|nr:transketolase isoform 3 [Homo sapiens]
MESYHKPDQQKLQALKDTANRLRISSIQATTAAGSGHPTSSAAPTAAFPSGKTGPPRWP